MSFKKLDVLLSPVIALSCVWLDLALYFNYNLKVYVRLKLILRVNTNYFCLCLIGEFLLHIQFWRCSGKWKKIHLKWKEYPCKSISLAYSLPFAHITFCFLLIFYLSNNGNQDKWSLNLPDWDPDSNTNSVKGLSLHYFIHI